MLHFPRAPWTSRMFPSITFPFFRGGQHFLRVQDSSNLKLQVCCFTNWGTEKSGEKIRAELRPWRFPRNSITPSFPPQLWDEWNFFGFTVRNFECQSLLVIVTPCNDVISINVLQKNLTVRCTNICCLVINLKNKNY